jgi:hypothetical protein
MSFEVQNGQTQPSSGPKSAINGSEKSLPHVSQIHPIHVTWFVLIFPHLRQYIVAIDDFPTSSSNIQSWMQGTFGSGWFGKNGLTDFRNDSNAFSSGT